VPQVRAPVLGANLGIANLSITALRSGTDVELVMPRGAAEFREKLRYLHRNPVKRELVKESAEWSWSRFRRYALREAGVVEIESEWTARDRETRTKSGPERVLLNPG
jgi:hypothetical protein